MRQAILLVVALSCLILAAAAHAEIRTLPGLTIQVAVTRIGCSVVIDGEELMNGTCHHRLTDTGEVFMTLPEAACDQQLNELFEKMNRMNRMLEAY
jgi:hypothetical protein